MTLAEIKKIGSNLCKKDAERIASEMLVALINKRKEELQKRIDTENIGKKKLSQLKNTLEALNAPTDKEYFRNIVLRSARKIQCFYGELSDSILVDLINAEYFGFTGRI